MDDIKRILVVSRSTKNCKKALHHGIALAKQNNAKLYVLHVIHSTKWIFVQVSGFNGFAVVDFATRKEIRRIQNPDLPPGKKTVPAGSDPSHGMAVTADGKTLVVCSRLNNFLYAYSLPDLKLLGGAELGGKGAGWVTLTPDGRMAYVANPVTNDVSVVDVKALKEVARIPVGFVPKRNTTGVLQ